MYHDLRPQFAGEVDACLLLHLSESCRRRHDCDVLEVWEVSGVAVQGCGLLHVVVKVTLASRVVRKARLGKQHVRAGALGRSHMFCRDKREL